MVASGEQISLLFCPFRSAGLFVLSHSSAYQTAQNGRSMSGALYRLRFGRSAIRVAPARFTMDAIQAPAIA
jgi:hypothetical protein